MEKVAIIFDTKIIQPENPADDYILQLTIASTAMRSQVRFDERNLPRLIKLLEDLKGDLDKVKQEKAEKAEIQQEQAAKPAPKPAETLH